MSESTPEAMTPPTSPTRERFARAARDIVGGSIGISILAVVLALAVGAVLIAVTDEAVQAAAGYFFSRPTDMLRAVWESVAGAYSALFQGSVYNFRAADFARGIRPLTETLTFATPRPATMSGVAKVRVSVSGLMPRAKSFARKL